MISLTSAFPVPDRDYELSMNPVLSNIFSTCKVWDGDFFHPLGANMCPSEGAMIHCAFEQVNARATLEIGLAYGISALFACDALAKIPTGEKVSHTAIDPWQNGEYGYKGIGLRNINAAGHDSIFNFIEVESEFALPKLANDGNRYDAVIIDGVHTLDHCLVDFFYVNRMLNVGGMVILDDTGMPSINKIVRYILNYPSYRMVYAANVPEEYTQHVLSIMNIDKSHVTVADDIIIRNEPSIADIPFDALGSAICLQKISEDDRAWNWYSNDW